MNLTPSKHFFRQSFKAHSWLGLMVGALMYLICISGSIAVYYEELERWEQPTAQEYFDYDVNIIENKFHEILTSKDKKVTPHMYVTLPTKANPRVAIVTENEGWFLNKDGSIGSSTAHPWTDVLTDLHLYLHLPKAWGMIFVSILGVLLLALIISGFASHRTLFKDAFKLRIFGSKQLEQIDLHNRLSVWGAPFHFMIGFTGAFFGLSALIIFVYAKAFYNGDTQALTNLIYGDEPKLEQIVEPPLIGKALAQMPKLAPNTKPLFIIVHDANTPQQFIEIFTQYPKRLIYSDNFVFDASGNFLSQRGFSDGPIGKQIVYSMYRLHFGDFGGWWVKFLYFILGISLTYIAISGINIWLAKRKYKDAINHIWIGFVWGTPIALVLTAFTRFAFSYTSNSAFWFILIAACTYTAVIKSEQTSRLHLQCMLFTSSVILITTYSVKYGSHAFTPLPLTINASILIVSAFIYFFNIKRNALFAQNAFIDKNT